jgi:protein-disulfide isomerase
MEPSTNNSSSIAIPLAIVFGFGLIAVAIYFSGMGNTKNTPTPATGAVAEEKVKTIRPVDSTDNIKGNPNASILIVEYSDYDCPFCKTFHTTMTQIMNEYGADGKIAWVYRQFPIAQLHPNSPRISEAALCVDDIGGNDAFWKFSDSIFQGRNIDQSTNLSKLPEYAELAGVKKEEFLACLDSGKMKEKVAASYADAAGAGIKGTPNSFILIGNQKVSIEGAQPYEVVKQIVENLIGQLEGTDPVPVEPQS